MATADELKRRADLDRIVGQFSLFGQGPPDIQNQLTSLAFGRVNGQSAITPLSVEVAGWAPLFLGPETLTQLIDRGIQETVMAFGDFEDSSFGSFGNTFSNPSFMTSVPQAGGSDLLSTLAGIAGQFLIGNQQEDVIKQQIRLLMAQQGVAQGFAAGPVLGAIGTGIVQGAGGAAAAAGVQAVANMLGLGSAVSPTSALAVSAQGSCPPMSPRMPAVIQLPDRCGRPVDYVRRGKALLYRSDLASAKRVQRVASRARRTGRNTRRSSSRTTTLCGGCTKPIGACAC